MRGFTFDARRAHLTFTHAANAHVDDVLAQLALPPVERGHDEAHLELLHSRATMVRADVRHLAQH